MPIWIKLHCGKYGSSEDKLFKSEEIFTIQAETIIVDQFFIKTFDGSRNMIHKVKMSDYKKIEIAGWLI